MRTMMWMPLVSILIIASAAEAKLARSLASVTDVVVKTGIDREVPDPLARNLKFDADSMPAKALRYKKTSTPDGKEHAFYVVTGDKGPIALVLTRTKTELKNEVKHTDAIAFRADLSGKLISAATLKGAGDDLIQDPVAKLTREIKKDFQSELDFYTKTMADKDFDR